MRVDASVAFVPLGGNLSLVAPVGQNVASNTLDLLGAGVGVAPPNIIGNAATFGTDFGVGMVDNEIAIFLASTPAIAGAGATLNVALQGAPDLGAGGNYQPGAWQTIVETSALTLAQLIAAQTGPKQQPIRMDWPPNWPANLNPRFMRLLFQMNAANAFTAGSVYGAIVTPVRDDYAVKFQPRNYTVA
jgi:hypothetical protein